MAHDAGDGPPTVYLSGDASKDDNYEHVFTEKPKTTTVRRQKSYVLNPQHNAIQASTNDTDISLMQHGKVSDACANQVLYAEGATAIDGYDAASNEFLGDSDGDSNDDTWNHEWDEGDGQHREVLSDMHTGGRALLESRAAESVLQHVPATGFADTSVASATAPTDLPVPSHGSKPSQSQAAVNVRMAIGSKAGMDGVDKNHVNAVSIYFLGHVL